MGGCGSEEAEEAIARALSTIAAHHRAWGLSSEGAQKRPIPARLAQANALSISGIDQAKGGIVMQELEATWKRVITIGWLIVWRGSLGGLAIGFAIGFVVGFIFGFIEGPPATSGRSPETVSLIISALTVPAVLAWWLLVVLMALRKRYKGFRLALVSTTE